MSVKADKWIIQQSIRPTHTFHHAGNDKSYKVGLPYSPYQRLVIYGGRPGIREGERRRHIAVPLTEAEINAWEPMIRPFYRDPIRYVNKVTGVPVILGPGEEPTDDARKVISFGTSSYGYDVRLGANPDHIKVFTNVHVAEINPKKMDPKAFGTPKIMVDEEGGKYVLVPPHSYIQAPTMEWFKIPRDILVIVLGKSTYARSALICNVTPIEPEFEGEVVIEIANTCSSPVRCYLEEGIAQFVFLQGDEDCLKSYRDKGGKYMHQTGLTLARV